MRLFTAVDVHPDIRSNAEDLQDRLSEEMGGVNWVRSEKMHITLKFLGDVEEDDLETVRDLLRACARRNDPFHLRFQAVGQFPKRGTPSVVWAGVETVGDGTPLAECHTFLDRRMTEVGVERDDRDFHPHLTLGRVKNERELGDVREAMEREQHTVLGEQHVDRLLLFRSEFVSGGTEYTVLDEAELAS